MELESKKELKPKNKKKIYHAFKRQYQQIRQQIVVFVEDMYLAEKMTLLVKRAVMSGRGSIN